MTSSLPDERVLVQRAIDGDADAFGELYQQHMDAIYRYVLFRVSNSQDGEDLTEQVFLKAWEALPGYEDRGYPFASWLYRIAHNAVVDFHRRHATTTVALADHGELASHEEDTLQQVIRASEMTELASAITRLGEEHQQIIVLRFVEGLDHSQVAEIMNKSVGACRVLQHRALSALTRVLAHQHHE
jgi:RNA polymerase sigma-70 factor (ECF subfamily)